MITKKASFSQPPTPNDIAREKTDFFKKLLEALDKELTGKQFFCGGN